MRGQQGLPAWRLRQLSLHDGARRGGSTASSPRPSFPVRALKEAISLTQPQCPRCH